MHPSQNHQFLFQSYHHHQTQQTKVNKTLLIESFSDSFSQQFQVQIPYDSTRRQLDIGHVLHQIFFQIFNPIFQYQVFYFSNENSCFCFADIYPFTQKFVLGEQFIPKDQIFIAYRKIQQQIDGHKKSLPQSGNVFQANKKKRRINDRTILETLQKVSLWRSKCQQQKITYEQAAKEIDIPKKTLDDYYALIRTGQQLGFDFEKNYNEKIGVLRQFVKQKQKQCKQKKENQKKKPSLSSINKNEQIDSNKQPQRKLSIIDRMMLDGDDDSEQGKE